MIEATITYSCRSCGSLNIVRNGTNKCGNPQYHCRACGIYRVLRPKEGYGHEQKVQILRGLQRVFGVWRTMVLRWLQAWIDHLPSLPNTLLPAQGDDMLELDEVVTFVSAKFFKR